MNTSEQLIHHFYTSFKNGDYKSMQDCYADDATFSDAIFKDLNAHQVRAMWEMLLVKGKDLRLEFKDISAIENSATAHWDAFYTFSSTGRKVVNRIDATFLIENGKISKHTDNFSFYTWAKQAFGTTGLLIGWTNFFHQKVATQAQKNLDLYMNRK